jgi:hypothetical protein
MCTFLIFLVSLKLGKALMKKIDKRHIWITGWIVRKGIGIKKASKRHIQLYLLWENEFPTM